MIDDIVTRLRAMMQGCENPNCEGCEVEAEAADEIERLRKLAQDLYKETKRCGSKHDVPATMAWEEYEMDFLYD